MDAIPGQGRSSASVESTNTEDWDEAQRSSQRTAAGPRQQYPASSFVRGASLTFGSGRTFFWRTISKPPFRAPKTHEANERALKHLRPVFEKTKLAELTADDIEEYLRERLQAASASCRRKTGFVEKGNAEADDGSPGISGAAPDAERGGPQEVPVREPLRGVEFPARVEGLFRPHYMTWSEQQKIEIARSRVPAERDPDHHGDRPSGLQGTHSA